jgi:Prophage CP4-57 regulatory protein (AlpA)
MHTILRLPAVMANVGLSRSSIYLRVEEGTFPGLCLWVQGPLGGSNRMSRSGFANGSN